MATIKSYTSIEQSRKLAEILPLESADMCYEVGEDLDGYITKTIYTPLMHTPYNDDYIPCWSLAALLSVLPNGIVMNKDSQNGKYHLSSEYIGTYVTADNPIDACVSMIEKLHELKML